MNKVIFLISIALVLFIGCSTIAKEKLHGEYIGTYTIKYQINKHDSVVSYPCKVLFYADVETPFIDLSAVDHSFVPSQLIVNEFDYDSHVATFNIPIQGTEETSKNCKYQGSRNFSVNNGQENFDGFINEDNQLAFGFTVENDTIKATANFNLSKKEFDLTE